MPDTAAGLLAFTIGVIGILAIAAGIAVALFVRRTAKLHKPLSSDNSKDRD